MTSGLFPGCVLIDLEGARLSHEEKELLSHPVCAGIILFSRNYQNPPSIARINYQYSRNKSTSLDRSRSRRRAVQRFREGFTILPPMSHWGEVYDQDPQACYRQLTQAVQILTSELRRWELIWI